MDWFRAYHGITSDRKWAIVARKAKVSVGVVVSVWVALLESASEAEDRGSVADFDAETVDALYGYEDGTSAAVLAALEAKDLICEGRVCAWDKRQPRREDDNTERMRRCRERKRQQTAADAESDAHGDAAVAPCDASVTECDDAVTHGDAAVTPQIREEKRREDIKNINIPIRETVNLRRARSPERREEGEGDAPVPVSPDDPGMEFVELRELYSRLMRAEGPRAGFAEYKQIKAARQWPGLARIAEDISARKEAGTWNPGFEIGLGRYLREQTWLAPITGRAQAATSTPTEHQRRQQESRELARARLAMRESEREAKNGTRSIAS